MLGVLPFTFACDWGWATIPLSILIAFFLLGIEASSVECERPFSARPTKNHHDLERFAILLSQETQDCLTRRRAWQQTGTGRVTLHIS